VHYRHTGAYEKASRLHRRALSIAEITLGFEHAQTAAILHELGVVEHARGQFAAGEPFARRSADIRQKTFGMDHPQVAAEFALIGALLEGQGKYDEAESLYRRALTIAERWFGPDHPEVATIANHLARVPGRERDASVVTTFRSSGLTAAV
jgi:tetratricopeptide (TPR) repeat protein